MNLTVPHLAEAGERLLMADCCRSNTKFGPRANVRFRVSSMAGLGGGVSLSFWAVSLEMGGKSAMDWSESPDGRLQSLRINVAL
jgi:hypothetical protein